MDDNTKYAIAYQQSIALSNAAWAALETIYLIQDTESKELLRDIYHKSSQFFRNCHARHTTSRHPEEDAD